MKEEKFKVINFIREFIVYIDKYLVNFPKKEIVLKNNLEQSMFKTIELIFTYNIQNSLRIKEKYLKDLVVELSMINYYMELCYEKKYISKHQ